METQETGAVLARMRKLHGRMRWMLVGSVICLVVVALVATAAVTLAGAAYIHVEAVLHGATFTFPSQTPATKATSAAREYIAGGRGAAGLVAEAPAGKSITDVTGEFAAPEASRQDGHEVLMVGVGGSGSAQVGVGVQVATVDGVSIRPYALTGTDTPIPGPQVLVRPGDLVQAGVRQTSGGWILWLRDLTTGGYGTITSAAGPARASAGVWVVLDPVSGSTRVPYAPTAVRFGEDTMRVTGEAPICANFALAVFWKMF